MKNLIKKYDEKGFTLMEMLIVVAIIAILVAIAFPIFNKQLNRARVATDAANIRSGYASATVKVLENKVDPNPFADGANLQTDGSVGKGENYLTQGDATKEDCKDIVSGLSSCNVNGKWTKGGTVTYSLDKENKVVTTISTVD